MAQLRGTFYICAKLPPFFFQGDLLSMIANKDAANRGCNTAHRIRKYSGEGIKD